MNELWWIVILCLGWCVSVSSQSITLDISYQQNTTYQWEQSVVHHMTTEYLGAEDMQGTFDQLGIAAYNESCDSSTISVSMKTREQAREKTTYASSIESYNRSFTSTAARNRFQHRPPLEIDDVEVLGVINRYQKMEIDSIIGVDSLPEKNRVFELIDNIHRSLQYPKDMFEVGVPITKTSSYGDSYSLSAPSIMETTYLLKEIINGKALFELSYVVQIADDQNIDELPNTVRIAGTGKGQLIYDITDKIVNLYEYSLSTESYRDMMGIGAESTSKTNYRWSMERFDK